MKSSVFKVVLGVLAAGAACLLADTWFGEKYFFQIKRYSIGKMGSRNRIKIVFLTDLHFKKRFWPFHQRLVRKINALHPDLLLLSGDVIDEHGTPEPARTFFRRLSFSVPKIVIPGNHDNKNGVSRKTLRKVIEQHNGRLMVNETLQLTINNATLTITGLDDFIEGESCFADAVKGIGKEQHHLLLVHSPLQQEKVLQEVRNLNAHRTADQQLTFQYIFAGHTHGGQVRWKPFVPVLPKKSGGYINGWYNSERPLLYVSKGFGTSAVPFRFGARAEITVFDYGV
jgi:hypothetical protein